MDDRAQEQPSPLDTIDLSSIPAGDVPPRQWIVADLIPDRNVTDLSGDGGLGKSLLSLQLAIAMTAGRDWLGMTVAQGPVLYASCEDERDEILRRRNSVLSAHNLVPSSIRGLHLLDLTDSEETELAVAGKGKPLELTQLYRRLEVTIERLRPKLVLLDTRADVYGASEIERAPVRRFVSALKLLCRRYDMAIIMLSHPSVAGMVSGTGQSGSTGWGNSVRSRLYLTAPRGDADAQPDPDVRVLSNKKANYGPRGVEIVVKWDRGMFRPDASALREVQDEQVETRFMQLLADAERQGRRINASSGPNYAPKVFREMDGKFGKAKYKQAMERLFAKEMVINTPDGRSTRLILTDIGMTEIGSPF